MNDSKRILVIGGAGLIGSHLCRSLVDRNYD
ncbi:MAG: NAD(P)-dependent oxidoreductase, partial [Rikenellaceae bacterium]|nr:NAD(P)-dependent oxidoreductase [Rikenellaceae bacterium]